MDSASESESFSNYNKKVLKSESIPQPEQQWDVNYHLISSLKNPTSSFTSHSLDELLNNVCNSKTHSFSNHNQIKPSDDENRDAHHLIPCQNLMNCTTFSEEMTLEDFLVREQIIKKPEMVPHMTENFGDYAINNQDCQLFSNVLSSTAAGGSNYWLGNGGSIYQNYNVENGMVRFEVSDEQPCKTTSISEEVAVERRIKRMVKNRESAARSRARKQAYTMRLKLEINQLKLENARLNFELEMMKEDAAEVAKLEEKTKTRRTASV